MYGQIVTIRQILPKFPGTLSHRGFLTIAIKGNTYNTGHRLPGAYVFSDPVPIRCSSLNAYCVQIARRLGYILANGDTYFAAAVVKP